MKFKILIADDEPLARDKLREFIRDEPDFEVAGEAACGSAALELARTLAPDVLLLDIQMPPMDGLQVVRSLAYESLPITIFTTAHARYAIDAYAANVIDYLLKPYSWDRFHAAIAKARELLHARRPSSRARPARDRLLVKTRGRYAIVQTTDIEWIEAASNYVILHTPGGNYVLRSTLAEIMDRLGSEKFHRTGRSTVVNLHHVTEVLFDGPGDHTLLMRDGSRIPLQRSFRELQQRLEWCGSRDPFPLGRVR